MHYETTSTYLAVVMTNGVLKCHTISLSDLVVSKATGLT